MSDDAAGSANGRRAPHSDDLAQTTRYVASCEVRGARARDTTTTTTTTHQHRRAVGRHGPALSSRRWPPVQTDARRRCSVCNVHAMRRGVVVLLGSGWGSPSRPLYGSLSVSVHRRPTCDCPVLSRSVHSPSDLAAAGPREQAPRPSVVGLVGCRTRVTARRYSALTVPYQYTPGARRPTPSRAR